MIYVRASARARVRHDLEVINHWSYHWKMEFNSDPKQQVAEVLSSPNHHLFIFNRNIMLKLYEQKHLGLFLDSKSSFERHPNDKIMKAKKGIEIIKYEDSNYIITPTFGT